MNVFARKLRSFFQEIIETSTSGKLIYRIIIEIRALLLELEIWAKNLGFTSLILETGIRQTAAIALYEKAGYRRIENYGPYAQVEDSYCFAKDL